MAAYNKRFGKIGG